MFFIKPEAAGNWLEILKHIEKAGLQVRETKRVLMTENMVLGLYAHVPEKILPKLRRQMVGKISIFGIVEGKYAIRRLVTMAGGHSESWLCQRKSIRFKFGDHRHWRTHFNAIHRPKTRQEVLNHLRLFGYG